MPSVKPDAFVKFNVKSVICEVSSCLFSPSVPWRATRRKCLCSLKHFPHHHPRHCGWKRKCKWKILVWPNHPTTLPPSPPFSGSILGERSSPTFLHPCALLICQPAGETLPCNNSVSLPGKYQLKTRSLDPGPSEHGFPNPPDPLDQPDPDRLDIAFHVLIMRAMTMMMIMMHVMVRWYQWRGKLN